MLAVAGLVQLGAAVELSPTLEVLPLNSTLSNVTIPRYDKDRKRVAYLKADLMEILADGQPINGRQPIMVDCTNIKLRMVAESGEKSADKPLQGMGGEIKVDMEKARYRLTSGVLTAQETITAHSPKFSISGTGGVFHLDSRRGFLFGPLDCKISTQDTAQTPTSMNTPLCALLATTSLVIANPDHQPATPDEIRVLDQLAIASSDYQPSTSEKLQTIEQLAKPSQRKVLSTQRQISQSANNYEKESTTAEQALSAFAEEVESNSLNLLIQNPPAANPPGQVKPPLENPDLTILCDGGCFFDGDKNLLVLLRNIVVKDKRFTMKAQEEVKVFFLATPEHEKNAAKKDGPNIGISDVKNLIATGGIHFSGIDKDGNPIEASAASAFYDHQTQTLILKDGQPTFWTKKGELEVHLQAEQKEAHIKIVLSEDTMRADTSPNGWKFGGKGLPLEQN